MIAVLDTGVICNHSALEGRVAYGRNFVREDEEFEMNAYDDTDEERHGTAVAVIASGKHLIANRFPDVQEKYKGYDDMLPVGVATKASLVVCRVATNSPSPEYVTEALKWIYDHNSVVIKDKDANTAHIKECTLGHKNKEENRIRIVSMSFCLKKPDDKIEDMIYKLNMQRVICVAAAGNDGNNYDPGWPALYETVLSVGSVDKDGNVSKFSTRHSTQIVVHALGEKVLIATKGKLNKDNSGQVSHSGSNLADPSTPSKPPVSKVNHQVSNPDHDSGTSPAVAGSIATFEQREREQGSAELTKTITQSDTNSLPPPPPPALRANPPVPKRVHKTFGTFRRHSGTSFATPAVAGLIAILVQCAREQGDTELAQKITHLHTLKQLFQKHMLERIGETHAWLLKPQKIEFFFMNKIENLDNVVEDIFK